MTLIVSGMGATLYSVGALTAFFVEGQLGRIFRERRMYNAIEDLEGHAIICGGGRTGVHVVEEHFLLGKPFVVIDNDIEHLRSLEEHHKGILTLHGDATHEETLEKAGIRRAGALVAALGTDKDNLYLTVTARYMCKDLAIIVRVLDHDTAPRFEAAGATTVVSPTYLGGLRLAAQVLQPRVVDFLDGMLQSSNDTSVTEAVVQPDSELADRTLSESRLAERVGLLVVALRYPGEKNFLYSPPGDTKLPPGTVVVVIGPKDRVKRLEVLTGQAT
jgi:voltage-gated potassium channel